MRRRDFIRGIAASARHEEPHAAHPHDGFNEGWIDFERAGEHRQGTVTLETVIAGPTGKGDTA